MSDQTQPLAIAVMALPHVTGSVLYGIYDLFSSPGRDWPLVVHGVAGEGLFRPRVVAAEAGTLAVANGLHVQPELTYAECREPDIVCIPDVLVAPGERLGEEYRRDKAWVGEQLERGATIASACSGALLLAEQGLLDGYAATTHWAYCNAFRRDFPAVDLHPNRSLVVSGPGQRIVMAGGGTSWQDLVLYLIARFTGVEEAMRVARMYLINWHDMGQSPYAALTRNTSAEDSVITRCQEWLGNHYDSGSPVAAVREMSGLSERSFNRRFARATGLTPLEYVQTLRLEEAKQLLEQSQMSVEEIANEVGYEDASFFSRLFRRLVQLTPAQYRRRFAPLREALAQASS